MYSKKPVYYNNINIGRGIHNDDGITMTGMNATQIAATKKKHYAKGLSIDDRITKFNEQLKNEYVYRIPLRYFPDLGKINFPTKINYRIKLHFETEMKKSFEYRKVLASGAAILMPYAKIIFTKAPFIQYEQILLGKNFRQYLETIMVSKKNSENGRTKNTNTKNIRNKCRLGFFEY